MKNLLYIITLLMLTSYVQQTKLTGKTDTNDIPQQIFKRFLPICSSDLPTGSMSWIDFTSASI